MADSTILDHTGKPYQKKDLSQEIARASLTGVRNVWNWGSEAEWISPDRLGTLLRQAAEGDAIAYLTLAEEMEERDLHYYSVLGTRKRALTACPVNVEAASDDAKDIAMADEVRELVKQPEFADMVDDLMDAIAKGYSAVEINWDTKRTPWQPRTRHERKDGQLKEINAYTWRDPRFFIYDREEGRELRLLDESDTLDGIPLAQHRWIIHQPKLKSGLQIRAGLARLAAVCYMCKAYTLSDWMRFAEVFGMPLRVGKYGPGATESDIRTLVNAIANIGTDAAAAIPDSMRIEFESAGASQGGPDMFKNLAEYLDKLMSKAVLGQTATTEGTPGKLGSDDAQSDVRMDILKADARQLSNTINKYLVRSYVDLNHGQQESYPEVVIVAEDAEDVTAWMGNVKTYVELGGKVEQSVVRDKLGVPDPEEDAELLVAPSATQTQPEPQPSPEEPSKTALNAEHSHSHQLDDDLAELEAIGLQNWQQQMHPILQPVQDLLDSVDTPEDFAAGLEDLLDEMDDTQLVKSLAKLMFQMRGAGEVNE